METVRARGPERPATPDDPPEGSAATGLALLRPPGGSGGLAELDSRARHYAEASAAESTKRRYRAHWEHFSAWCEAGHLSALPAAPLTVRMYLAHLADQGVSASTIAGRVAALATGHRLAGYTPPPTRDDSVKVTLAGIRRTIGTARGGKLGVTIEDLRTLVAMCDPETVAGVRDRALLVLCFAGAFRRSELVSLDVSDVDQTREGLRITLRRSKTDQEGAGVVKGLPYGSNPATCPVRTLEAWLEMAGIAEGPLFRPINRHGQVRSSRLTDRSVALVVQRAAERAGLDPNRLAGHSLRRGFATTAARNRVPELTIMRQTGHRSLATLRVYVEEGTLFTDNAAAQVGL